MPTLADLKAAHSSVCWKCGQDVSTFLGEWSYLKDRHHSGDCAVNPPSALVREVPAWCALIAKANEDEAELAAKDATIAALTKPCTCDMRTRMVGDGCEICNPRLALNFIRESLVEERTAREEAERRINNACALLDVSSYSAATRLLEVLRG